MQNIAQNRETVLTALEIATKLQNNTDTYALLNEAGVIYLTATGEERKIVESILLRHLWSHDENIKFICYCQLQRANGTGSDRVHGNIELFQKNHNNLRIVEKAREKYWL